jgi:hypothetical protein
MSMGKLLITVSCNYADEFDMSGWFIIKPEAWEEYKNDAKKYFVDGKEMDDGFGTNEYMTFTSYEDLMYIYEIKEISDDEAQTIERLFASFSFGYTGPDDFDYK